MRCSTEVREGGEERKVLGEIVDNFAVDFDGSSSLASFASDEIDDGGLAKEG
jgi:hypothetical protein